MRHLTAGSSSLAQCVHTNCHNRHSRQAVRPHARRGTQTCYARLGTSQQAIRPHARRVLSDRALARDSAVEPCYCFGVLDRSGVYYIIQEGERHPDRVPKRTSSAISLSGCTQLAGMPRNSKACISTACAKADSSTACSTRDPECC